MSRNDDMSLILAKAKRSGFFDDVKNEELDYLKQEASLLYKDDPFLSASLVVGSIIIGGVSYERFTGETEDGPRLRRAITAGVLAGYNELIFGPGTFTLNTLTTVSNNEIMFRGSGVKTVLTNGTNTTMLDVTGAGFQMFNMQVAVTDSNRTNFPITVTGGVRPLFDTLYVQGTGGTKVAGIHFVSGSMGTVSNCIFNHASIKINTWDVKIDRVYIWAMSCEFGIGIYGGAGNTTLTNVDIVPPLVTTTYGIAAIVVDGTTGSCFNTKMIGIYLDGNPTLDTRKGIYVGNGAGGTLLQDINANRMDSDCIVIDSAYNVIINGYSGHTNNDLGRGSREIFITKTGTQSVENIQLSNIHCLRTTAVVGTVAPAIEVDLSVDGSQVVIHDFMIKQPGGGGGYTSPEVKVDSSLTSLSGKGQVSKYSARGSQAVSIGATSVTITLSSPYPMAYRPALSDIHLSFDIILAEQTRIQFNGDNQIVVTWTTATGAAGNVFWRVDLRK